MLLAPRVGPVGVGGGVAVRGAGAAEAPEALPGGEGLGEQRGEVEVDPAGLPELEEADEVVSLGVFVCGCEGEGWWGVRVGFVVLVRSSFAWWAQKR